MFVMALEAIHKNVMVLDLLLIGAHDSRDEGLKWVLYLASSTHQEHVLQPFTA